MSRSVWKGPYVHPSLLKKVKTANEVNDRKPIKTWARSSVILPQMEGLTIAVHNGKTFVPVSIVAEMIGQKLGCFSPTRSFPGHSGGDKKAKKPGQKK